MLAICRTCFQEIQDENYINLDSTDAAEIKRKLATCVPQLELVLVRNAVICISCSDILHLLYNFKNQCLYIEKHIRQYMKQRNTNSVSLIEIFKDTNQAVIKKLNAQLTLTTKRQKCSENNIAQQLNNLLDEALCNRRQYDASNPEAEKQNIIEVEVYDSIEKEEYVVSGGDFQINATELMKTERHTHDIKNHIEINPGHCSSNTEKNGENKQKHTEQVSLPINDDEDDDIMIVEVTCFPSPQDTSNQNDSSDNIESQITRNNFCVNGKYVCNICGYSTNRKQTLQTHAALHTNEKSLTCNLCSFKTINEKYLVEHQKTHKNVSSYLRYKSSK